MKHIFSLSLVTALILVSLESIAIPSTPRDLECRNRHGDEVILRTNNGFWSFAQGGRYWVALTLDKMDGGLETLEFVSANNEAQRTRGNDVGNRRYVFKSAAGEFFNVELEFIAPFGAAEAIKIFRVSSPNFHFKHTNKGSDGLCRVVFHEKTEI
jgi:hypothetical protein